MDEQKEVAIQEKETITRKEVIHIIFIILMMLAIGALIATIFTISKYGSMLVNPVGYNLAKFGINSCTCTDTSGKTVLINAIGYKPATVNFTGVFK